MIQSYIERVIAANTKWLETHGQHADPQEYATVAMTTTQLIVKLEGKKETAESPAVSKLFEDMERLQLVRGIRLNIRTDKVAADYTVNF